MNLSQNFTLDELVHSDTAERLGIDNMPSDEQIINAGPLLLLLEDVRALLGKPIHITSGYRCPELNRRVGGSAASDHMQFRAADFVCPKFGTPRQVALAIVGEGLVVDQLIWEGSWVHISAGPRQRQEVLTARFANGHARYLPGIA